MSRANYCEDYPCCGHTDADPCPGRGAPVQEPWYCDDCGGYHTGGLYCPLGDWDEDEEETEELYESGTGW